MNEETWHQARLIPTSGISGVDEQERRATSAFLAVLGVVKEFGRSLLGPLGAPAGAVETFIEVPFTLGDAKVIPDGLIRVIRGQRSWTALVEVKTGKNELQPAQLNSYLDVARDNGFDALITISNELPALAGQHPTAVDKRKLKKVSLHHWAWSSILSTAVMQKEHRGVTDPEQGWILGELIRYLEHPRSGALEFDDMGSAWVPVRQSVSTQTLRPNDQALPEVVTRFDALLRYVALRLGRQLGTDVSQVLTRKELSEPGLRPQTLTSMLVDSGRLSGAIKVPQTVGPVQVTADLRASRVICSVDLDAPREGRALTRVNWLLRQLKAAPDSLRIEAFVVGGRGPGQTDLLGRVRENPAGLIVDPKRELRSFRLEISGPMGAKRGRGANTFIDSVVLAVDSFYADVVQVLKPWSAAPPKLRDAPSTPDEPAQLTSTALSSQDGPELDGAGGSD